MPVHQAFDFQLSSKTSNGGSTDQKVSSPWRESTVRTSQITAVTPHRTPSHSSSVRGVADFFSPEVFRIVLHNPTTAHQLLKFSQARFCGENLEFLEKVDRFSTLLDELTKTMSEIHTSFTSPDAPRQLNLSHTTMNKLNAGIKKASLTTMPALELIFAEAEEHVEEILATQIYPRFVKHQMTLSAVRALSNDRGKYAGLGDCFCLTNPAMADNPILFASDGFVKVTGYSRADIIPRNCRFLQGEYTDRAAVQRLKTSIGANRESIELLLNYRKTGEPFWNLLYVAPLLNASGEVVFFLGGQINCSTTIHNCSDILRVLSVSDEQVSSNQEPVPPSMPKESTSSRAGFFKSFRSRGPDKVVDNREAGMEQELLNRMENMNFKNQVEMFYTAYSKYLVLSYDSLDIKFFSSGIVDMLYMDPKAITSFVGNNVFKVLSQHATNISKDLKNSVKSSLKVGRAISVDISLLTRRSLALKRSERFALHWTPLKDEHARVRWVVVALAGK
ncbi:hypothetical protein B0A49_10953 [Cryomyces minteri]|uniref:RGS domain-containing protein n=2 Tax=Cryomyces minteri TaxID=331657 RepID=A0A4U0WE39_9PEZI|nr:hypothetical protein B0A49_10953 [Cryomyces minteri]